MITLIDINKETKSKIYMIDISDILDLENSYYDLICDFLETLNSNDIVYWRLDSIGGNTFVMFKLIKSHLNCKATSISIVSKAYSSIALLMLSIPLMVLQKEVENKNFANVEFLLNCGADVNICDEFDKNIIYKEILKGYSNYRMIDFLVFHGANIDARDTDEKSIVDDLVEIIAMQKGFKKISTSLLSAVKSEEKYDVLLKKVLTYKPNIEIQRLDGTNILFDMVLYNDFETLKIIINYGLNLNIKDKRGYTPLMHMVEEGLKLKEKRERESFIERLVNFLKYRVNVDIQDNDGKTVIHKAVMANDLAVVEKLLSKKADLTIKDNHGRTALHHTQWHGNYKIARWLIASGADINMPDSSGFTLLNYAAIFGHTKLVVALIASGVLMYNRNPKSRKVAEFFKNREKKLDKLLASSINDDKMHRAVREVVENLKKEINEVLQK
jgi:ankyrin repeat protein